MAGADMLGKLHGHGPCNHRAPITTLRHKLFVPQHINHDSLETASCEYGSETIFGGRISRAETWYAWDNDVESLRRSIWRIGEWLDDLACF